VEKKNITNIKKKKKRKEKREWDKSLQFHHQQTAVLCLFECTTASYKYYKKVKQSRYRPGVAQRVPGS
jgi:hypothetical protein